MGPAIPRHGVSAIGVVRLCVLVLWYCDDSTLAEGS
jgi:hypothetical protein